MVQFIVDLSLYLHIVCRSLVIVQPKGFTGWSLTPTGVRLGLHIHPSGAITPSVYGDLWSGSLTMIGCISLKAI